MNIFKNLTLRSKIIGMVLISSFLLTAGGIYAFNNFANHYKESVTKDAVDSAIGLGNKIGAQFYERYGDIQAFAVNPVVRELNAAKLNSYLNEYVKLYGIYDVILVVDKNGDYVGSNSKDSNDTKLNLDALKHTNFKSSPWFEAAINEKWTEDKTKNFSGTYFDDIHVDPIYEIVYGKKQTGTGFTTVIRNENGEKIGVITNRTNNKWFESEMATLWENFKKDGHEDAEVSILNKDGYLISEIAPKRHDNKMIFETDLTQKLFVENFFKEHVPAGEHMKNRETSAIISRANGEDADDLVGYHYNDNSKWISTIGWTLVIHQDAKAAYADATQSVNLYYGLSAAFFLISLFIAVWLGLVISKSVDSVTSQLARNSKDVSEASLKIAAQATELSEASTEQAAAIQQTVAAVDEISAMVDKNSDAANKSKDVSTQSREAAIRGRQTVDNMIQAINEINSSNEEISYQMDQSNRQLNDITKLINDIGTKTRVINEIVFQTKLLSFNASVEAARAGEYGKGFAVVAEEVGNLAQMSGNAAKEITDMLEQSIRQVESIVSETKSKVERLMNSSKEKVSYGAETAKECNAALEEILNNVSSVDALVSEIAVASTEQSTGIREISKAVGQMEEVTQQNSAVAQGSSIAAEQLSSQSTELNEIVLSLVKVVKGSSESYVHISPSEESRNKKSTGKNNVLKFSEKKPSYKEDSHKSVSFKKVSGSDIIVPSSDDPGFED